MNYNCDLGLAPRTLNPLSTSALAALTHVLDKSNVNPACLLKLLEGSNKTQSHS